jgi:hypothetical protein
MQLSFVLEGKRDERRIDEQSNCINQSSEGKNYNNKIVNRKWQQMLVRNEDKSQYNKLRRRNDGCNDCCFAVGFVDVFVVFVIFTYFYRCGLCCS